MGTFPLINPKLTNIKVKKMTKKYRLNFDWNGFEKGHVFDDFGGNLSWIHKNGSSVSGGSALAIDLLIDCGALTEIKGYNLGINGTCSVCNKSYCLCPERQSDGSWKPSEVKKIEPLKIRPKVVFEGENYYDERPATDWDMHHKINELVKATNSLLNTKLK